VELPSAWHAIFLTSCFVVGKDYAWHDQCVKPSARCFTAKQTEIFAAVLASGLKVRHIIALASVTVRRSEELLHRGGGLPLLRKQSILPSISGLS